MAKIEIKKVKLSNIKLNPDNPRFIKDKQMDLLVKSLKENHLSPDDKEQPEYKRDAIDVILASRQA